MIGLRVKNLRMQRGINQKELADKAGLAQATISRLENERSTHIEAETVARIAKALGTTTDHLLTRTDCIEPSGTTGDDSGAQELLSVFSCLSDSSKDTLLAFGYFLEGKKTLS